MHHAVSHGAAASEVEAVRLASAEMAIGADAIMCQKDNPANASPAPGASNIRPSGYSERTGILLAVERWYDFPGFGGIRKMSGE